MGYSPENDPHHRGRRKGTANRQWLVVSSAGESYLEEVGKHSIMKRTGLPARDLRVLDPLLSYPSTILGRERAIVINLEQIKAVITATEVLVPNSKDPMVGPFVKDLIDRVSNPNGIHHQAMEPSANACNVAMPKATSCWPSFPRHHRVGRQGNISPRPNTMLTNTSSGEMAKGNSRSASKPCKVGAMLPLEFKALEGCLESACRSLESETLTLEKEAYPALDELTSKLSTLNLERVRQLKSRLVAISGRVQKVRDELEHLLDDDMDMAEMYLSEKLARQPVGESSAGAGDVDEPEHDDDREEDGRSATESSRGGISGVKPNVEELEMLLEAYFVQIDGTLNKLSHLREYVDDTEDYINIMLDEKQNQLLQMGVMLSTATLVLTAGVVVVSIFGMNIGISLYDKDNPPAYFWQATSGTIAGCVGLYILAIGWGKKSGLLQ